jgi:hypothetical protein
MIPHEEIAAIGGDVLDQADRFDAGGGLNLVTPGPGGENDRAAAPASSAPRLNVNEKGP